jgi:mono/diheme cytochrome c family protein
MLRPLLIALTASTLFAQPGPTDRQKVDPAAAKRGRALYAQYCINCHGAAIRGSDSGPDLVRSLVILRDRQGSELSPALKRIPNHNATLTTAQVTDLSHFFKELIDATVKNRDPQSPPNVLTGDARGGKAYFEATCSKCHSPTGDLSGIGLRYKDPVELQQRFLFPRRNKPLLATVTLAQGAPITGEVQKLDDFDISIKDSNGQYHSWTLTPSIKVEIDDPLTTHHDLLDRYNDQDIHNVVRYLESLK